MILKRIIFFVFLPCFVSVSFSQENSISDAIKKNKITFPVTNSESSIDTILNNNLAKIESKDQKSISDLFLNDLSVGVSYGISEFRGDIKQDGFINSDNTANLYSFWISKEINKFFSVSSEILAGDLSGSKSNESYLIANDQSAVVYDPYGQYEGLGEKFTADFLEFDLIASINLESIIEYYYSSYEDNNDFDVCYNIGFGIISFKSMKSNIESDNYIYSYGYDDQQTIQNISDREESLLDRPKAGAVCYGYSLSYSVDPRTKWKLIFSGRLVDTDFLDASLMSDDYDKFRNISLGLDYIF